MPVACFLIDQIGIACERVRLNALWGEPFALSLPDNTLCVVSDEAASRGVRAGLTASSARALCPALVVLPYDKEAYCQALHCVWDLQAIESSFVEPVSPEICYMAFSGPDILARARQLASHVAAHVRIPVRVGMGKTKLVAYQAALQSDSAHISTVEGGSEALFLAAVPLQSLEQLPPPLKVRLERLGVRTLGDILRLPSREMRLQFKQSEHLLRRLAVGEDGDPVRPLWPPRTLTFDYAFEDPVEDEQSVLWVLHRGAEKLSGKLLMQKEYCRLLEITIRFDDGTEIEQEERLSQAAHDAEAINRAAVRILRRLRIEQPVASIEMRAGDLGIGSGVQLALLDENDQGVGLPDERRARLEAALRTVRRRHGFGSVMTLSLLHQARRIHLWTYALTRLTSESVQVATDGEGLPVRYRRGGKIYSVRRIQNRWKETDWFWDSLIEKTAYRIETDPSGFYELYRIGMEWRLGGTAD